MGPQRPPVISFSLESRRLHHHHQHQSSNHRPPTAPPPLPDRGRSICPGRPQGSAAEVRHREEGWAGGRCSMTQLWWGLCRGDQASRWCRFIYSIFENLPWSSLSSFVSAFALSGSWQCHSGLWGCHVSEHLWGLCKCPHLITFCSNIFLYS